MSAEGEWPTTQVAIERLRGRCELNPVAQKTLEKLREYATSPMMGEDCVLPEQEEAGELVLEVERLVGMNRRLFDAVEGYRGTVEKLPVTADGVRVVPGVDRVWFRPGVAAIHEAVVVEVTETLRDGVMCWDVRNPESGIQACYYAISMYSSREALDAAEAAAAEERARLIASGQAGDGEEMPF